MVDPCGAGDMAFLARAMVGAAVVFVLGAGGVLVLDLGIGWLWASIGLLMLARVAPLSVRWAGDEWAVTGTRTDRPPRTDRPS